MKRVVKVQAGYTLIELVTGVFVFGIIALSFLYLFTSLVSSTVVTKRKAQALSLATNQMEYLKSLPYNSLAVAGGSIVTSNPLPATKTETVNGVVYTIKTNIEYIDDAFDGCGSYPNLTLKQKYCRNYPPPTGSPATDTNPADYKMARVSVTDPKDKTLAQVDTQISARVAETASTTGALFVSVIDSNGNPVSGATVQVSNSTTNPNVSVSDNSDSNGTVIFYGLPVDTNGYDYIVTASKNNYSSLTTIAPAGSLQPNYVSQQIFTQLSSFVTLPIKLQGQHSLLLESTTTSGAVLPGVRVYLKGGYKKYTATTDTSYYFDNMSPDTRPTTDGGGLAALDSLVPGSYFACGDSGSTSCVVGGTNYYLAAAVPYVGASSLGPITVPIYDSAHPPATTFAHNGVDYLQKVRLMFTTSATMPRLNSISIYEVSQGTGDLSAVTFSLTGTNLPCSASAGSCATDVAFTQGGNNYAANCTGTSAGMQLDCTVNLTGTSLGTVGMTVAANSQTLTIPSGPHMGVLNVTP